MTTSARRLKRDAAIGALLLALWGAGDATAQNWPSFRGLRAGGVGDGQDLPIRWNADEGLNIAWRTFIPGLAHSSPVIWGDRLFVTTAVSSAGDDSFKAGLYGDGTASEDRSVHEWKVIALDKRTGKVLWERVACEGTPKDKRHIKANSLA